MKILGYVLAFLFLLSTAFVALAAANKSHKLATQVGELTKGMSAEEIKMLDKELDKHGGMPSAGRLDGGAVVGGLGGIAALALLIAALAKKSATKMLAAVTIGAAALSAIVYPHVETGPVDGAAPRTLAFVAIVLAALGAVGAMLAAKPKA